MSFLNNILNQDAYCKNNINYKKNIFKNNINKLTSFHFKKSNLYKNFLIGINHKISKKHSLPNIPFLPVRLFKEFNFLSINKKRIFKTLFSSGTSSNKLSKIYLDKQNAMSQIIVLQKIFNSVVGSQRLPMLIVDRKNESLDRSKFNASIAAINGFSIFAKETVYLLDENNEIDYKKLNKFLKKNLKKKFLIFGFTHNIYLNLIKKIDKKKIIKDNFKNAFLIHGGGWKKIEDLKLSRNNFNLLLKKKT
jgi:hypothetical protein